jgi:hypothetical protein
MVIAASFTRSGIQCDSIAFRRERSAESNARCSAFPQRTAPLFRSLDAVRAYCTRRDDANTYLIGICGGCRDPLRIRAIAGIIEGRGSGAWLRIESSTVIAGVRRCRRGRPARDRRHARSCRRVGRRAGRQTTSGRSGHTGARRGGSTWSCNAILASVAVAGTRSAPCPSGSAAASTCPSAAGREGHAGNSQGGRHRSVFHKLAVHRFRPK